MKIVYVNENRHERILRAVSYEENENVYVIPKDIEYISGKKYLNTSFKEIYPDKQFSLFYRWKLGKEIKKIADIEKPDIIHFVSADDYLRVGGIGLRFLRKYKTIATLHWCKHSIKSDISRNIVMNRFDGIIFHVKSEPVHYNRRGEKKTCFLVLPPENIGKPLTKEYAREKLGFKKEEKIYCFIGYMEEYKGVDVLLESIKYIDEKITLLMVGKPGKYTEDYFRTFDNNKNVTLNLNLNYVSDEDFTKYVCASDYVLLPYKRQFQATSGPLTEAIRCGVPIIAPDYGNLGDLTRDYELGYSFESENPEKLAQTINRTAKKEFQKNSKFYEYKKMLDQGYYREQQQKFYSMILENHGK